MRGLTTATVPCEESTSRRPSVARTAGAGSGTEDRPGPPSGASVEPDEAPVRGCGDELSTAHGQAAELPVRVADPDPLFHKVRAGVDAQDIARTPDPDAAAAGQDPESEHAGAAAHCARTRLVRGSTRRSGPRSPIP